MTALHDLASKWLAGVLFDRSLRPHVEGKDLLALARHMRTGIADVLAGRDLSAASRACDRELGVPLDLDAVRRHLVLPGEVAAYHSASRRPGS